MSSISKPEPKSLARACQFCRSRKIRCDNKRPSCGSCTAHRRDCVYKIEPAKQRPSTAAFAVLQTEQRRLKAIIRRLKTSQSYELPEILNSITVDGEEKTLAADAPSLAQDDGQTPYSQASERDFVEPRTRNVRCPTPATVAEISGDGDLDLSPFFSVDEMGNVDTFGPSSALQSTTKPRVAAEHSATHHIRNALIANAVLQRQREHELHYRPDIMGVPTELALHLLNLHWNRQHHAFLLTYRPAVMRDLQDGGPNCSEFMLNAIFACVSKYSPRIDTRDDPSKPETTGGRFFRRCDELLSQKSLLFVPSIPTVVGLLMLGATYVGRGETSKGWLHTGYALRMVNDLGLHLDRPMVNDNAEETEIRRRVFWGAFICDKLQSLYLGRPIAIHLRDARVSRDFLDTIEEREPWAPYADPGALEGLNGITSTPPTPCYSISTFQQLCSLSQLMARIINNFYVAGATVASATNNLQSIDDSLAAWKQNLPLEIRYDVQSEQKAYSRKPSPNVLLLHSIYNSLIILLHRPLISDGHLRSSVAPISSWKRCTEAASNITNLGIAYETSYTLRGAPYMLGYAIYVASTIHVRNAAALERDQAGESYNLLTASLRCLDILTTPSSGLKRPISILKKLIAQSGLNLSTETQQIVPQPPPDMNLDAIVRMFPYRSPDPNNFSALGAFGQEQPVLEDLLYGFMSTNPGQSYGYGSGSFGLDMM